VITNKIDDELFEGLFHARSSGLNAYLIQSGPALNFVEIQHKADYFGFPLFQVLRESDMDVWRK
jgi:hypothetical protein